MKTDQITESCFEALRKIVSSASASTLSTQPKYWMVPEDDMANARRALRQLDGNDGDWIRHAVVYLGEGNAYARNGDSLMSTALLAAGGFSTNIDDWFEVDTAEESSEECVDAWHALSR